MTRRMKLPASAWTRGVADMARIPTPPDYNDTGKEFARRLHDCRREDFTTPGPAAHAPWYGLLLAMLLGLCLSVLTSCGTDADAAPATPVSSPTPLKTIPQGVCPPGHVGMWIEHSVVECFKELP
ncbi:Uncharacterised protein [uncultured Comamonas sp.]|nr:Uncharacterised protein [uncultured Comamonas sp.]